MVASVGLSWLENRTAVRAHVDTHLVVSVAAAVDVDDDADDTDAEAAVKGSVQAVTVTATNVVWTGSCRSA